MYVIVAGNATAAIAMTTILKAVVTIVRIAEATASTMNINLQIILHGRCVDDTLPFRNS